MGHTPSTGIMPDTRGKINPKFPVRLLAVILNPDFSRGEESSSARGNLSDSGGGSFARLKAVSG